MTQHFRLKTSGFLAESFESNEVSSGCERMCLRSETNWAAASHLWVKCACAYLWTSASDSLWSLSTSAAWSPGSQINARAFTMEATLYPLSIKLFAVEWFFFFRLPPQLKRYWGGKKEANVINQSKVSNAKCSTNTTEPSGSRKP